MSAADILWQEISVAALLGTQRKPFQLAQLAEQEKAGELGDFLKAAQSAQPPEAGTAPDPSASERLLLRTVAVTALHRRAGRLPALRNPTFPPLAATDEWPRCSLQAGRCLEQILSGDKLALLPEWVEIAAATSQRVREEQLPLMLDQSKAILPIRRSLLPVLGERGRWLAAQNPQWSDFTLHGEERAWSEGQCKERQAYLEDLRAQDPDRARDLLTATWPEEPPAERVAFLQILANQLSLADEPFLETTLDDRRKEVRQAATALLAKLPESRLVQRMTGRVRSLLNWKSGLLRTSLDVSLPAAYSDDLRRDGIDPRPPANLKVGERAWWFAQVLSFVPPRTWSAAWNRRPLQILDPIRKHEWEEALLLGWSEAALRAQDAEWLEALVNYHFRSGDQKRLMDLFPRLPAPLQDRLAISLLREYSSLAPDQNASLFLSACRHPWSRELTQAVTSAICQTLQKGDLPPWRWEKLLRDIPPYFHPDLLIASIDNIAAALAKKEAGDPYVSGLLAMLEFRLTMRQAFHPSS